MPPAKTKTVKPASLSSRIRLWLLDHPGGHSAAAIADGVAPPPPKGTVKEKAKRQTRTWWSQTVSAECVRMCRTGKLVRERTSTASMGPGVLYRLPHEIPTPTLPGETDAGNHST